MTKDLAIDLLVVRAEEIIRAIEYLSTYQSVDGDNKGWDRSFSVRYPDLVRIVWPQS